ncbi:TIR domain-containing protein [Geodermatophilus africanus]|uniref:TIR domain-containing protein n=1 Tax=Geodermatophilus africanus TaxID=1137993 RepID=A0A1H3R2K3_9ACTN|nr:TIR domain-containing protein [Geodermatophilus africanus]
MGGIFVSYRDETVHSAGRLGNLLGARFGPEHVFMADSIDAGADAVVATMDAVGNCDVLIVVIGPTWLTGTDDHGRRRIDQVDDLVGVGISSALRRGITLLPVLVHGAEMPAAEDVPERVRGLARHRAVRLDHMSFHSDAVQLIDLVESALPNRVRPRPRSRPARRYLRRPSADRPSHHPVPLSRAIRRVALWWAIFFFAILASEGLFGLVVNPTETLGAAIAGLLSSLAILSICATLLRWEIRAQRRMIAQSLAVENTTRAYRAVSNVRVRLISLICILIAIMVGVSVATSPIAAAALPSAI